MTYERTFKVTLDEDVRLVRTHPKQYDRIFEYYFRRHTSASAWMPWEDGTEPTEHVLEFAREVFEGEVVEWEFHEEQTTLGEFNGDGDSATTAGATEAAGTG